MTDPRLGLAPVTLQTLDIGICFFGLSLMLVDEALAFKHFYIGIDHDVD